MGWRKPTGKEMRGLAALCRKVPRGMYEEMRKSRDRDVRAAAQVVAIVNGWGKGKGETA